MGKTGFRKPFLLKTTGLFLLLCCGLSACSQPEPSYNPAVVESWKLGSSSGILEDFSWEEFQRIRTAGIDHLELGLARSEFQVPGPEREEYCRALTAAADQAGVRIWSVHIPYGKEWDISSLEWNQRQIIVEKHRRLFETFEILKPAKAVIHASFEPVPDEERELRKRACRDALKLLTAEALKYDVRLAVECLPRTCLGNSSEEILSLVNDIEGLEVCCDVNHLLFETPQDFISRTGSRITTLHISDYDGKDEKHWLPGEGIIEWNRVIDALVRIGYSGPFLFECRGSAEELAATWNQLKTDYLAFAAEKKQ